MRTGPLRRRLRALVRAQAAVLWLSGAVWLALPMSGVGASWEYRTQSAIDWQDYDQRAFDQAARQGRPVFVLIYADWCAWCKKYELETLETEPIRRRLATTWLPIAVDQERRPGLARELGATLVPTTILATPGGKKILRFHGVLSAPELAQNLDRMRAAWLRGELPDEEFGDERTCCPLPNNDAPAAGR